MFYDVSLSLLIALDTVSSFFFSFSSNHYKPQIIPQNVHIGLRLKYEWYLYFFEKALIVFTKETSFGLRSNFSSNSSFAFNYNCLYKFLVIEIYGRTLFGHVSGSTE